MIRIIAAAIVLSVSASPALAAVWKVEDDIARLKGEVPSLAAFHGSHGVVWSRSIVYQVLADGTRSKTTNIILQLSDDAPDEMLKHTIPYPTSEGARVDVNSAGWYSMETGWKRNDLVHSLEDEDGLSCVVVTIPKEAKGELVVISVTALSPMTYYLEDVVELAGPLPIWEQTVEAVVPAGMQIYWEGRGLHDPVRETDKGGVERIKWRLMNQHAQSGLGVIANRPPMLAFSLQRGLESSLRTMANMAGAFKAPPMPRSVSSAGHSVVKAGTAVHEYLKSHALDDSGTMRAIRGAEHLVDGAPMTMWERTLTAAKWLSQLGFSTEVFWRQRLPITSMGPSAVSIWAEPVLKISQGGGLDDIFYAASQRSDFGKLDYTMYGVPLYRFSDGDIERIMLPKGSASEHTLVQNWKLSLSDQGDASGKLDMTVTGAWVDVLGLHDIADDASAVSEAILRTMTFPLPGLSIEAQQVKNTSNGLRITFSVQARLGIVSGNDILMKIPGGLPNAFKEIPENNEPFEFCFPFVLEQNAAVTTPPKYRTLMLPPKESSGSSRSQVTSTIQHWPKRRVVEAAFSWIVRNMNIDETSARDVAAHSGQAFSWSASPIPLRK